MVHPTNLLRSDSEGGQQFSNPVGNYFNDLDCGVSSLPCLTRRLRLRKFAKLSIFLLVLSLLGLLHGVISTYFKGTSQLWFSHYNFPSFIEEWFLFLNEIFVGILALCISYWGDRLHRTTCMGALTMLIAVSGATLALPEIYNPFSKFEITNDIRESPLCSIQNEGLYTKDILGTEGFNEVTFGYFFIFQILYSMVTISFITHGLTYIDDHVSSKHSPALLGFFVGLALAAHEVGKQLGIYFSWVPSVLNILSIFSSPVWILLTVITFMVGAAMAMFPKMLPNMLLKKSVNSFGTMISASGISLEDEDSHHCFHKIICLLFKNKVLLLNIMSLVLMQSALMNFSLFEKYFNQSKYHLPLKEKQSSAYSDPDVIQFTTNLLRHPLVAVCFVMCGTIISKTKPKPKYLVTWNIVAFVLVIIIFSTTVFWNCTNGIHNEHKNVITIPFCSSKCGCPIGGPFRPVCVDGNTYYSPCLAGCRNYSSTTMVYQNCSCGAVVTAGSCDQDKCKFVLALAQVNNIMITALVASTLIINFVITLRSVPTQYKAIAIGLELTFLGVIPFIPVKIIYHSVTSKFCEIRTQKGCRYFSEYFPLVISALTICSMLSAILFEVILLCCIKDLDLYPSEFPCYDPTRSKNNIHVVSHNGTNETPDGNRTLEEESPFIRQLGERIKNRFKRPFSREERIQTYMEAGEPRLEQKQNTPRASGRSSVSNTAIVHTEPDKHQVCTSREIKISPRNNNKKNSKSPDEPDMSSLFRFTDCIVDASDGNDSEPSIKVSQGKIIFQTAPQNIPLKTKKTRNGPLIQIAPDSTQPQRPAPVPDFFVETM